MNSIFGLAFTFTLLISSSTEKLVQTGRGDRVECKNITAQYRCTNSRNSYINWQIVPRHGARSFPSFISYIHPEGSMMRETIGNSSSAVIYRVIHANDSYISVVATLLNPELVDGARITCNEGTLFLNVTSLSNHCISVNITLAHRGYNNKTCIFALSWTLRVDQQDHMISIAPAPTSGPRIITTNDMNLTIGLERNVTYSIVTAPVDCPEKINKTLIFGNCPLVSNTAVFSVVQYEVQESGVEARVQCHHEPGSSYTTACGQNGHWSRDISELCRLVNNGTISTDPRTRMDRESNGTDLHYKTEKNIREKVIQTPEDKSKIPQDNNQWIVVIFSASSFVICAAAYICGQVMRCICGIKIRPRRATRNTSSDCSSPSPKKVSFSGDQSQVYEEIKLKLLPLQL